MPDPTPAVLELARRFRVQLLARERRAASGLVRYYGRIWQNLQGDISGLQAQVERMREADQEISEAQIWRLDRMRALQAQSERELARYAQFADDTITAGQREAIIAGERNAHQLLMASFPRDANIQISFATMPREAVEAMVGFLQDGSPLRVILDEAVGEAAQEAAETLVAGLAQGWNPRKVARALRADYGMGLTRSLRVARTEQLRAYRTASDEQYKQSGVVLEKERLAAQDDRTCMACVMLDGKKYALDEPMDDHVQGRCVFVPITKSYRSMGIDVDEPDFTREKASDWFLRQDEATQRTMMGPGMYDAWREGEFTLNEIPGLTHSDVWGDSWSPKSLKDLVGENGD